MQYARRNGEGTLLHGSARPSRSGETVHHHLGVSGFATHAAVDRVSAVPVGDDIPAGIAAVLGCAVFTGGGAVLNAARPKPEDSIMILGLGGAGMAALITAISPGFTRIVPVDTLDEKLEHARRLGAHGTYTPKQLLEDGVKAKFVIECTGNPRAFETAFPATAVGGTTITADLPRPDARCPCPDLAADDHPVEELISARIALAGINKAMDQLADGKAVRQVIMFNAVEAVWNKPRPARHTFGNPA